MFCTISETDGEVVHVKLVLKPPSNSLLTNPRRLSCCGSQLLVFGVRVSVTFHLTCVHIIFREIAAYSFDHMLSLYFDYL